MINKRLIGIFPDSVKYVICNVIFQWISLGANIVMIFAFGSLIQGLFHRSIGSDRIIIVTAIAIGAIIIRYFCTVRAGRMSYLASKFVKENLRRNIYKKLLKLGAGYTDKVATSEVVQLAVEGVEQLETYFGSYLPQLFYSLLAPVTLFVVLSFVSLKSAVVLLICVPLIPVSIIAVQKFAKKLLTKYWGQYTELADNFLENLQGLTTFKIYQADEHKNTEMNGQAEHFRRITMRVLTMQLNSVLVMDIIAYGGAALGVIMAISEFRSGNIGLAGCFNIIMLSADFFIPMRLLGSYFHTAMNGMAASEKIFRLLDLEEPDEGKTDIDGLNCEVSLQNLCFSYDEDREILNNISMVFPKGCLTSIVGESGSGKSTIAGILSGVNVGYSGEAKIADVPISEASEKSLHENVTLISHDSYMFKGTVRDNLRMGDATASDEMIWTALESVKLSDFFRGEEGLETKVAERASNFSGGQRQRLALARALLHNSPVYIFDEATSNIDVESEDVITQLIYSLAEEKTVIVISHRLANVKNSDNIYVMESGRVIESGNHKELIEMGGVYERLWDSQMQMENYIGGKDI